MYKYNTNPVLSNLRYVPSNLGCVSVGFGKSIILTYVVDLNKGPLRL